MLSVLMAMAAFTSVCIPDKRPRKMMLNNLVRLSLHAGHKFYACLGKCRLCASADAAADDEIHLRGLQESRDCTMPLTNRIHDLCALHRAILNVIEFELVCSAEMLLDDLFRIGYCNSHNIFSFILNLRHNRIFHPIGAACNANALPADECIREFEARRLIDTCHRRAGNPHRSGTFFLCLPPMIDQSDRLELIQVQYDRLLCLFLSILGSKTPKVRIAADTPASFWSGHRPSFSVI